MKAFLNEHRIIRKIIFLTAAFVAFCICVACYYMLPVKTYFNINREVFEIPGIDEGFVPQGMCADDTNENIYITGYMSDKSASPLYVMDNTTEALKKKVLLADEDGNELVVHAGGVTYYKGYLFVAGSEDSCLYAFEPESVENTQDNEYVAAAKSVKFEGDDDLINIAFVTDYEGILYVGEYRYRPWYKTSNEHVESTADGFHGALMLGVELDEDMNVIPKLVYSLPDKVQGAAFDDKNIYLSTSCAIAISKINGYSREKVQEEALSGKYHTTKNVLGVEIPLYLLDKQSKVVTLRLPPMAEEIAIVNNEMYVLNEAASNKYKYGKMTGCKLVYAVDMDKLGMLEKRK